MKNPIAVVTATAAMIDGIIGQPSLTWYRATRIADMLIIAPMDRSNTPAASGISTAMPSMATIVCSAATEWRVSVVRNLSGVQMPNTTMKIASRYNPLKRSNPKLILRWLAAG